MQHRFATRIKENFFSQEFIMKKLLILLAGISISNYAVAKHIVDFNNADYTCHGHKLTPNSSLEEVAKNCKVEHTDTTIQGQEEKLKFITDNSTVLECLVSKHNTIGKCKTLNN